MHATCSTHMNATFNTELSKAHVRAALAPCCQTPHVFTTNEHSFELLTSDDVSASSVRAPLATAAATFSSAAPVTGDPPNLICDSEGCSSTAAPSFCTCSMWCAHTKVVRVVSVDSAHTLHKRTSITSAACTLGLCYCALHTLLRKVILLRAH
jgi:hypothetical protein